jgi:hypothetical protein
MTQEQKKPNYGKAIFFFTLAIICITAIVWNYMATVVPAKEAVIAINAECDKLAEETRAFNIAHPGYYVRPPRC